MKISKRAGNIAPSLTRKLFNMAKQYDDVIDLTLGDPDIIPDERIRSAAKEAIDKGYTRYSANAGLLDLRKEIANCFTAEYGLTVDTNEEIIATVGGMEALFLSLSCIVDDGDEVIVLAPYYVNYVQMIKLCGGVPIIVYTNEEDGFQCDIKQLESVVTDKTVAIIINTPCNPTGMVLSKESLKAIAKFAQEYDLAVISDEVYKTLIYDGLEHQSIVTLDNMKSRTVVIDSMSKRFSMTGYRLGYAVGPTQLISAMTKMQENVAACAPLPSQYAGITAYSQCSNSNYLRDIFEKRRDYLVNRLNQIDRLSCKSPSGAFYLFVNIKATGMDCQTFCYELLEKAHVAAVPGICYGEIYDGYVRIAYTLDISQLEIAADRIKSFVEQL